jgi:hypothetical protein
MTEEPSQTTDSPPADPSLAAVTHVTAGASAPDNATLTPEIIQETASQMVVAGSTGEGVDESGKKSYAERKAALLSGSPAPAPAPAPPAQPEPVVQEPAPAAVVPPTDEDDVPLIGSDGKMPKMRIRTVTPVDVRAIAEFQASQKAGNEQSFLEFVRERYPAEPAPVAPAAGADPAPGDEPAAGGDENAPPDGSARAKLDAAYREFEEGAESLSAKEQTAALRRILELQRAADKEILEQEQERLGQQTEAQKKAEQDMTDYLGKAAQMFPQAVKADDPLVIKAGEVLKSWIDGKDPRAGHASAYLYSYVEAAAELGIAPAGVSTPPPSSPNPSSTPSPVHRPPLTAIIAGGNAATTQTMAQVDTRTYEEKKAEYLARTAKAA